MPAKKPACDKCGQKVRLFSGLCQNCRSREIRQDMEENDEFDLTLRQHGEKWFVEDKHGVICYPIANNELREGTHMAMPGRIYRDRYDCDFFDCHGIRWHGTALGEPSYLRCKKRPVADVEGSIVYVIASQSRDIIPHCDRCTRGL